MTELIIRAATAEDLPTLLRFEQGVIAAERPYDPTLQPNPIVYYDLDAMIAADYIELVVAEFNGQIVGSGYARIEKAKAFYKYVRYAYLGFMYVEPAFRGQGINQKIILHLQNWAALRSIHELRLEVYTGNIAAIKAYAKMGFKDDIVTMRLNKTEE